MSWLSNTWKEIFSRSPKGAYTVNHEEIYDKVEFKFSCKGRHFYAFKTYSDMISYRYFLALLWQNQHLQHIPSEKALEWLGKIKKHLKPTKKEGEIDIGKALIGIEQLEQHINRDVDPETLYRLASCVYFYKDEKLDDYNMELNNQKIALWKRSKMVGFFFRKPMSDFIAYNPTSEQDFQAYLTAAELADRQRDNILSKL